MDRTRVRWPRLVIAAALVGGLVLATGRVALGGGPEAQAPPTGHQRYVVRSGDTLWEIARAVVGPAGDPRPLVDRIREANALAPAEGLLPGTSLAIPGA